MINFQKQPDWKVLELGNGQPSHMSTDVRVDKQPKEGITHFSANLDAPHWNEIGDNAFDIVLCSCFSEIATDPNSFLRQVNRILKQEGRIVFESVNTDAGGLHTREITPSSISKLLNETGFKDVLVMPVNENRMSIEAQKVSQNAPNAPGLVETAKPPQPPTQPLPSLITQTITNKQQPQQSTKPASEIYNRLYFEHYQNGGFYWAYPHYELIFRKILNGYAPGSVLELGAARGYVLKKFQDTGIRCQGIDVSRHAWATRVCDPIIVWDLIKTPWPIGKEEFEFVYSINLLEHIPEASLPAFVEELKRVGKRGVHAIFMEGSQGMIDGTRCCIHNKDWWKRILPETHEVVDVNELIGDGNLPADYVNGDGKIKLNLGSYYTMSYQGWININKEDCIGFAGAYGYKFLRHDITQGLPYATGVVDLIFSHHQLEHLTYAEGLRLLRECRRVIRKDGAMRIVVPDFDFVYSNSRDNDRIIQLSDFNAGAAESKTNTQRLYSVIGEGHKSFYCYETLDYQLREAGWNPVLTSFRKTETHPALQQIQKETTEMSYCGLSLFVDALPAVG